MRSAAGHSRTVSADVAPENAHIAAPGPFCPSVWCHVQLTGPSLSKSGASSAFRQNALLSAMRNLMFAPICGAS